MKEIEKVSVDEYIDKYNKKPLGGKNGSYYLTTLSCLIGLGIAVLLFFLVLRLFEIHEIAGYVGIGFAVVVFVFFFIVPMVKVRKNKAFTTNLRGKSIVEVKRYNRGLRKDIATKMVDIYKNADVSLWYSSEKMSALDKAVSKNNDKEIKALLTDIYATDVKKASNNFITSHAIKVFAATAISQNEKLDSLFVAVSQLDLIKRIVLLYGFRPSDDKLLKIYKSVLISALLSYGAQSLSTSIASGVGKKIAESASSISFLGGAIETVLGSAMDGVANLTFTVKVGVETKKYLAKEYHLQDVIDEMEDDSEIAKEETELIAEAKKESSKIKKPTKK